MARMIATGTMTVLGKTYQRGDAIPADKLDSRKVKQLHDQRRIEADSTRVSGRKSKGD